MKKVAFVTPWFGEKIPGGAEMELRGIVAHLSETGLNIEILSTCVKDFSSNWNENYYQEGVTEELGVIVRRFAVRKRDTASFDAVNYKLMNNIQITSEEEDTYFREMINSPNLYKYMEENKEEYSLFIFIPYMFGTTYYGCQICPEKSILIPCLHDESYAYMEKFKNVFSNVGGMIFHARPEQWLAEKLYNLNNINYGTLGEGIDTELIYNKNKFREKFGINSPFILYAGRKDAGKNVDTLLKYFAEYKKRNKKNDLKLVLIGGGKISFPESAKEDIIDLGFVDAEDKYNACAAAELLCQPSHNESFSLVIMESWLCERPVIVSDHCEVTKNFVRETKGGLYFKDYFEFESAVNYIVNNTEKADLMGKNGKEYVMSNFKWDVIVKKYIDFFEEVANKANSNAEGNKVWLKNKKDIKKIALVNQRYGLEVNGGSELYCRQLAEKLKEFYNVEVLTTCALDYMTWENYYQEGTENINGITVRRFSVDKCRDVNSFNKLSEKVFVNNNRTLEEEEFWIESQGPYCPKFLDYMEEHYNDYDAVIFITYLYYLTAKGIVKFNDHSYLLPTAHDEAPIYMNYYKDVFESAKGMIYLTHEEKEFVESHFNVKSKPSILTGAGVDLPDLSNLPNARKKLKFENDYILYIGRIDESKGCGTLFKYFIEYKKRNNNSLKLVLAGKSVMDIPKHEDIVSLGFIDDDLKFALIKDSKFLVLASEFESLSMVVLESMIMKKPVLVNGRCEVLKGHCLRSRAGLYFKNYFEFEGSINYLLNNEKIYSIMCENGKKYVDENYQWDKIIEKIRLMLESELG